MDEWEPYAYQKIKQDFANELVFLDKAIDAIEKCTKILIKGTPLLNKPNLNDNLKNSKPVIRRSITDFTPISRKYVFASNSFTSPKWLPKLLSILLT